MEPFERPDGKGPWVLRDNYHARKQNPDDYRLEEGVFSYQGVFGFSRIFDHLEANGIQNTSVRTSEITSSHLEGFDALFVNLVSDDRPDFSEEEVTTILTYVEEGGGLFVVGDHTNVYRHAERINRFLKPMGVDMLYATAVEREPDNQVSGSGWIWVDAFEPHPTTEGLDAISLQTGGPMQEEFGVAFTSARSFADLWNPGDEGGYYGDWQHGGDDAAEPFGPLAVVAAREYGEGRVVVIGDQNMLGDAWVHYANNFELGLNIFDWVLKREGASAMPLRETPLVQKPISIVQAHTGRQAGSTGDRGLFSFFVNLNRIDGIAGRASPGISEMDEVVFVMSPSSRFNDSEVLALESKMMAGQTVVVSLSPQDVRFAEDLLQRLEPSFEFSSGDAPVLGSESLRTEVDGLSLGSRTCVFVSEEVCGLWSVQSSWGDSLVFAELASGRTDVARFEKKGEGRLVVLFQEGLFRNQTLGDYLEAPSGLRAAAHDFQFAFVRWLADL